MGNLENYIVNKTLKKLIPYIIYIYTVLKPQF